MRAYSNEVCPIRYKRIIIYQRIALYLFFFFVFGLNSHRIREHWEWLLVFFSEQFSDGL